MNILHPDATPAKCRETYSKVDYEFPTPTFHTAQELAEMSLAQTREAYERSKSALEASLDTLARSFDSLSHGASALNRKIIDIAQRNVNSGFDLAKSVTTAKNLAEVVELRAAYWRKQLGALAAQAEEVRELSAKVAGDMTAPIKAHVNRSMDKLRDELSHRD